MVIYDLKKKKQSDDSEEHFWSRRNVFFSQYDQTYEDLRQTHVKEREIFVRI